MKQAGKSITVTEDWSKNWQARIAVRITSIVIWSLTVLSMVIADLLISQVKENTENNQAMQMDQLAHLVSETITNTSPTTRDTCHDIANEVINKGDIESIQPEFSGTSCLYGEAPNVSEVLVRTLYFPEPVKITAHVKPLNQIVRDKQIQIFMIISAVLVLFGGFPGLIIDKYVRRPFQRLEAATQEYIAGDKKGAGRYWFQG